MRQKRLLLLLGGVRGGEGGKGRRGRRREGKEGKLLGRGGGFPYERRGFSSFWEGLGRAKGGKGRRRGRGRRANCLVEEEGSCATEEASPPSGS
jgi:hypothetical protein